MALILAAVMAVSCATTILLAASKNWSSLKDLGALSQYYETGADADPGAVSTVPGDPGGTSFGLYMFSSKAGTLDAFRTWLRNYQGNAIYNGFAATLDKAYGENTSGAAAASYGPNFESAWRELGHGVNKGEFANAQTEYWGTERYSTLISRLQSKYPSLNLNDYSIALKNVLWSRSVQHGVDGAYNVVTRAIDNRLGGFKMQSEAELIEAIYTECSKLAEDIPKYRDMQTQLSDRYGVKNRSMAYYSAADGDVQSSVYSRLHINEPADALVMRYQNTTSHLEGKYTLCYNSDGRTFSYSVGSTDLVAEEKASQLILTYYNSDKYTMATTDGKRLAVVDGALMLQNAAADSRQFWTLTGSNNGYILCNVGTGNYLTITVSQTQVADPNARTEPTEEEITAKRAEIESELAKGADEETGKLVSEVAQAYVDALTKKIITLMAANLDGKKDDEVIKMVNDGLGDTMDETAKQDFITRIKALAAVSEETKPEDIPDFTDDEMQKLLEIFAGKKLEDIEKEVVADMVREDLKAKAANTTVTAYKVGLSKESQTAAVVTMKPAAGQDAWNTIGLFYPQKAEKDETGKSIVHNLTQGNSSFPLRGIVTCTQNISTVKAVVTNTATGTAPTYASRSGINAKWFDLWELDETLKFSKLSAGKYTLTITGTTDSDSTVTLLDTTFTVGAATTTTPEAPNNTYTVTFVVNGKTLETRTYKEAQPYGALPEVDEKGFQGWFYNDREISQSTPVAPKNHTVTAKFGTLHTVKFMSQGAVWDSYKLAQNDIITLPATNPVMQADSKYVYSFDYWADASGKRYTSGTVMPDADVTYTAVFTKTANSGGGTGGGTGGSTGGSTGGETPKPSGNYLTGVSPSTSVSAMNRAGYTIYSGSTKVTSGLVGTGMTAVSSSATVTIVVTGDVSGDGKITITDVVKLQKSVVGSGSLSGAYAKAADINGDGKVTITDVVQAAQVTVGQRTIG